MTSPAAGALPGLVRGEDGRGVLRREHTRRLGSWTIALGVLVSAAGFTLGAPATVALGAAILSLGFVCIDLAHAARGGVTPITFYAFSSAVTGAANWYGLRTIDTPAQSLYFVYASSEDLMLASSLAWAGAVLPVLAFWAVLRGRVLDEVIDSLPMVRGEIGTRVLMLGGLLLSALAMATRIFAPMPSLGTVLTIFFLVPHFVAFTLARAGAQEDNRVAILVALIIASAEAMRALMFDYLRSDILAPFVAFAFGVMLGRRSLRALVSPTMAPIWLVAAVFVVYFGSFGQVRANSDAGLDRLLRVQQYHERAIEDPALAPPQTVLSRLTSFNQLSQIGRLVRQEGHFGGETLEYLGYAFIPRFVWPEKPLIAKGAWFAAQIGQAYIRQDGSYSNSINMTVVGELYLNFGWLGVLLGAPLFGALLAAFWSRTAFWKEQRNVLGGAFAFYLLWIGFGLAADLQILVTLVATYLLFVAAATVRYRVRRAPSPIDGPLVVEESWGR